MSGKLIKTGIGTIDWILIDKSDLRNKDLTLSDRGMLVTLHSMPEEWNWDLSYLKNMLQDSEREITHSLMKLAKLGYIETDNNEGEGR